MLKKFIATLADRYFEKRLSGPAPKKRWHHLYDVAIDELKASAGAGDADAAFVLGDIYDQGQSGQELDRAQAVIWYEKAAALGHGDAMNNLGSMYEHGDGPFPVDLVKALDFYERGWKAGCATSANNLGHFHAKGRAGLTADRVKANRLFRQGAKGGDGDAMVSLGYRYSNGAGLRKSPIRALYWYRRALQAGNPRGANNLAAAYYYGTTVKEDAEKAVLLFFRALEDGFERAAYMLGRANETGHGTGRDLDEALYLFRRAADDGHEDAPEAIDRVLAQMGAEFSSASDPEQRLEDLRAMIRDPQKSFSIQALLLELARVVQQLADDRESPAADQPSVLGKSNLIRGFVLWKQGNPDYFGSVDLALSIDEKHPFMLPPERAALMTAKAVALSRERKWGEAVALHRRVLKIVEADPEAEEKVVIGAMIDLAFCLHEAGEFREARQINAEALARAETIYGTEGPGLLRVIANLAQNEFALGHAERAAALMRRRLAIAERHEMLDVIGDALRDLAIASFSAGDHAASEELFRRKLAFAERNGGPDDIAHARADLDGLFERLEKLRD